MSHSSGQTVSVKRGSELPASLIDARIAARTSMYRDSRARLDAFERESAEDWASLVAAVTADLPAELVPYVDWEQGRDEWWLSGTDGWWIVCRLPGQWPILSWWYRSGGRWQRQALEVLDRGDRGEWIVLRAGEALGATDLGTALVLAEGAEEDD